MLVEKNAFMQAKYWPLPDRINFTIFSMIFFSFLSNKLSGNFYYFMKGEIFFKFSLHFKLEAFSITHTLVEFH